MSTPVARVVAFQAVDRRAVYVPSNLHDMLSELARQLDMPVNDYVVEILITHMRWVKAGALRGRDE